MLKVLIADDEEKICKGIKLLIDWDSLGAHKCSYVHDGAQALNVLNEEKYDILITDIRMPKVDGMALIKKLDEINYDIKVVILSGFFDYNYAKTAIQYGVKNYILKPINEQELQKTLFKMKDEISAEKMKKASEEKISEFQITYNLIKKDFDNNINILADKCSYDLAKYSFSIMLVDFFVKTDCAYTPESEKIIEAKAKICSLLDLENTGGAGGYNIHRFNVDKNRLCVQFWFKKGTKLNERKIYGSLVRDIKQNLPEGVHICASVGDAAADYHLAYTSYEQACTAMEYRIYFGMGRLICFSDIKPKENTGHDGYFKSVEKIASSVSAGDKAKSEKNINEFFRKIREEKCCPSFISSILLNLFVNLKRICADCGCPGDMAPYLGENGSGALYVADIHELQRKTHEISCRIIAGKMANENRKPLYSQVIEYINGHYNENITLRTLSEIFYINNVYLGRVFKDEMGQSYNDYLKKIRIEEAAALLKNTNMKVSEVSYNVGYKDINYFYKLFKKLKGMTPIEYKKSSVAVGFTK